MPPERSGAHLGRLPDEALLRRVAEIEDAPFEVLFHRHSAAAFSLARHMLGPVRAEEAVQEAFLDLWRTASRYDPSRGSVRTWLLSLVRNRSIDALRRLGSRERRDLAVASLEQRLASEESIEADFARREQAASVRAALATLPIDQRRVLELAYFGGWSQVEIAGYLDVPLGTVKGRARLGLSKLRAEIDAIAPAPG